MKPLRVLSGSTVLVLAGALLSSAPAFAGNVDPGNPGSTVHWYPSKSDIRTSPIPKKICFSGTVWDRAAYDDDFKITGKIWEPSLGRRVHLQRKSGKKWVTVKSIWTSGPMVSPNYVTCIGRKAGTYRVQSASYYPYNAVMIRAHATASRTVKVR